jgi:hypothetical protein
MDDETILNGFMDGFAKAAEDAGLRGEQVRRLLELSVDLAQRGAQPEAFDTGFASMVFGG